ncbi:MAG: phosphoribosyl-AMP cyclohydrolase [Bauldia sp.]|nr:phosphoribosyl-AMP cyclohydrolase [Bauldia sp.]
MSHDPALETGTAFTPQFDASGLIPVIVTDAATGEVVMFAWMNAEALALTRTTGFAHYWSRSRKALWKKGETSGNVQRVVEMRVDCDQDALWLRVETAGDGANCHTGAKSCFYRTLPTGEDADLLFPDRAAPA